MYDVAYLQEYGDAPHIAHTSACAACSFRDSFEDTTFCTGNLVSLII